MQTALQKLRAALGQLACASLDQQQLVQAALQDLDFLCHSSSAAAMCAWASASEVFLAEMAAFSSQVHRLGRANQAKIAGIVHTIATRCKGGKEVLLAMPAQVGGGAASRALGTPQGTHWCEGCEEGPGHPAAACPLSTPRCPALPLPLQALAFELLLATSSIAAERAAHIGAHAKLLLGLPGVLSVLAQHPTAQRRPTLPAPAAGC